MTPDPAMEVLCLLPRHPITAARKDLMDDTGLTGKQLTAAVYELARIGIGVNVAGWNLSVRGDSWRKAQAMGTAYLDQYAKAVA